MEISIEEELYLSVGHALFAQQSQMFGKPCFKANGKAFICFFQKQMVFKLTAPVHTEAISLQGAALFDPSGKNRPMKEWVQLPFTHSDKWEKFAKAALEYVAGGEQLCRN